MKEPSLANFNRKGNCRKTLLILSLIHTWCSTPIYVSEKGKPKFKDPSSLNNLKAHTTVTLASLLIRKKQKDQSLRTLGGWCQS